jgi:Tol biopolymer transport system component
VSADAFGPSDRPPVAPTNRLDSWKEIATYLKRDVTTVRRWEKREGLPVHRHQHTRRDSVYAYADEIDGWWQTRRTGLAENGNATTSEAEARDQPSTTPPGRSSRIAWTLAAASVITVLVLVAMLLGRAPADRAASFERRFAVLPPPGRTVETAVLSPDGRQLLFTAAAADGPTSLYVQPLDSAARPLRDTEGATFPFWSPASDAIGFFSAEQLWTMRLDREDDGPRSIAVAARGHGGTWNRDGTIVFAPQADGALYRTSADGGGVAAVTTLRAPDTGHLWPHFLPDGRRFLYLADVASTQPADHYVMVSSLDGGEPQRLTIGRSNAIYNDGYLLYQRDRRLLAQPFDATALALNGEPVPVVDRVQQHPDALHYAHFSAAGDVLTFRAMQSPSSRLVWRDRDGRSATFVDAPAEHCDPTLAPDESRVALAIFQPELSRRFGYGAGLVSDIFLIAANGDRTSARLTSHPDADWGPVWSPDGRSIVFSSNRRGRLELFRRDLSASNSDAVPLATQGRNPVAQSWSPDGQLILYSAFGEDTSSDLWLLQTSRNSPPTPLLQTPFREEQGQISPDGRWFAHTSNETGREEVYVRAFPTATGTRQISTDGGGDPRWSRDGTELFYISPARQLMAVRVTASRELAIGRPTVIFETGVPPHWYEARNLYDVTRGGRFLFTTPVEDERTLPLTAVLDWDARLRRTEPRREPATPHRQP